MDPPAAPEESPVSDRTRPRTGQWHGAQPGVRPSASLRPSSVVRSTPVLRSSPVLCSSPGGHCDIQLQNPCRYPEAGARRIRPWLSPVVAELAPGAESFGVRFISDREMKRMNSSFRQRDATTDVLSFPAEPSVRDALGFDSDDSKAKGTVGDFLEEKHLGDVVISVPAARRQAEKLGHGVDVELRILLLHGVLHCLGYDHETDDGAMDRLEARLRLRYIFDPLDRRDEDGI